MLDIGKTNIKLNVCTPDGAVLETLTTANAVLAGPPWAHHDLKSAGEWVMASLSGLCRRHLVRHLITTGHGSGGMLVARDPDAGGDGLALPMVDYEQPVPAAIDAAYAPLSGSFFDRGSAVMMAATHQARQMYWMAQTRPDEFARAGWYLGVPQYWAWRFSGVAASEATIMGAQSHLWNVPGRHWSPIVAGQGWRRLLPQFRPAWAALGPIRAELRRRYDLPGDIMVHCGAHDSSVNFYRYQAAGLADLAVVSTGTWIVAMARNVDFARLDEARSMACNSDVTGAPVGGALTMGGREFAAVAGPQPEGARADPAVLARLIDQGTFVLPAFGQNDGQFPGRAGLGCICGPAPETAPERLALAVLYMALLSVACVDSLGPLAAGQPRGVVLDGSYLADPAYAALVAALRLDAQTLFNPEAYGVASGAAVLCGHPHPTPVPLSLSTPVNLAGLHGLAQYGAQWRALAAVIPKGNAK